MTKKNDHVICHKEAHIFTSECGAPEFFTGGAKLIPIPSNNGLINEENLINMLNNYGLHGIHEILPSAISLTQASELGTVYEPCLLYTSDAADE